MNKSGIYTLVISIIIILVILIILNITKLSKTSTKEISSDSEMYDYISKMWGNFDYNNIKKYTEEQLVVISIVAYDVEVNNGGLDQFFTNSTGFFAPYISENLEKINATEHKKHYDNFIKKNKIDIKYFESFISGDIDEYLEQYEQIPLDDFDRKFYELEQKETLYDLVIEYAKENYNKIFIDIKKNF